MLILNGDPTTSESITRVPQTTTASQTWSTSNSYLSVNLNGEEYQVKLNKKTIGKKIVVVGSSVAFGVGATAYNGWANMLKTTLEADGFTVENRGISGNTTANVLTRFDTDVASENPDFVIIALSLVNDGILAGDYSNVYNTFKQNIITLIKQIIQIGAIPIIGGGYPHNSYTAAMYKYVKQWNMDLETMNVPYFNFLGACDDGSGNWITGTNDDDGHPNDTGHDIMYKTIPLGIFYTLFECIEQRETGNNGCLYLSAGTDANYPLEFIPSTAYGNFTIAFWMRDASDTNGRAFLGINDANRVRDPAGILTYTTNAGTDVASTVNPAVDKQLHFVAITHNKSNNTTSFYVDNALIGTTTETLTATQFVLGGRADAGQTGVGALTTFFKDCTVYRTCLNADELDNLYNGKILKGSLDVYAPMNDQTLIANNRLANYAKTKEYFNINTSNATHSEVNFVKAQTLQMPGGYLYLDSGTPKLRQTDGTVLTFTTT